MDSTCAVIPAAGRGSRLGLSIPKILLPIDGNRTVWTILRERLLAVVPRVHVVLSPEGERLFRAELAFDQQRHRVSTSIQPVPRGMGDAIFGASPTWETSDIIVVLWGDQVLVSEATLHASLAASSRSRCVVLALTILDNPYVQYDLDSGGRLLRVRQSREGDVLDARGQSDVGLFVLSTSGLRDAWQHYLRSAGVGAATSEINFLPFLPYLSVQIGWTVRTVAVANPAEAIGINTLRDLEFARARIHTPTADGRARMV